MFTGYSNMYGNNTGHCCYSFSNCCKMSQPQHTVLSLSFHCNLFYLSFQNYFHAKGRHQRKRHTSNPNQWITRGLQLSEEMHIWEADFLIIRKKCTVCRKESSYFNRLWRCKWMVIRSDSPGPLLELMGICWSSQFNLDRALLCLRVTYWKL